MSSLCRAYKGGSKVIMIQNAQAKIDNQMLPKIPHNDVVDDDDEDDIDCEVLNSKERSGTSNGKRPSQRGPLDMIGNVTSASPTTTTCSKSPHRQTMP